LATTAARVDSALISIHARHARALVDDDDSELLTIAEAYGTRRADLYAIEAAARASTIADRRGDRPAHRRATALLRELPHCDGAVTPALIDVQLAPLSPREREVARLASSGLTSREIGERLHLSVRTVDNVLQRSYAKLGIAGRRELRDAIGPV
jgi:DNA-binding CsgD family transcriptional regulator